MTDPDGVSITNGVMAPPPLAGTAVVVRLAGEVDLATAEHAGDQLRAAEAVAVVDAPAVVVLDLTQVTFLGSVGLAMLVEHNQLCSELGSRLCVIVGDSPAAWRPIKIATLDTVLTIVSSVDEALGRA